MADHLDIPGHRGNYRYFFIADISAAGIAAVAGNYAFLKPTNAGWVPVYFGIGVNLRERLPSHEMWQLAVGLGATRVAGHRNKEEADRIAEEKDLISYWNPPLNTQHRSRPDTAVG